MQISNCNLILTAHNIQMSTKLALQAMTKGKELLDYIFGLLQVGERERFGFRFEDQRRISFWLTEELEILSQLKNCE